MLKKIPASLAPELVMQLMKMGEGEELLIAGRNYPAGDIKKVYYINGSVKELLGDVLMLMPLSEGCLPATMYFEEDEECPLMSEYFEVIKRSEEGAKLEKIDRLDKYPFLNRAERVSAAVITADGGRNCEIILTKGRI